MALRKPPVAACKGERLLAQAGYRLIAGLDEVGRGSWAGPLVAAAVILPPVQSRRAPWLRGVNDSKLVPPAARERLAALIRRRARAVGVGMVSPDVVDLLGLSAAGQLAMWRALRHLDLHPDYILVDAFPIIGLPIPQRAIIHGDRLCVSIAAASIIAKVARDRLMRELAGEYPNYGFEAHKGYGTAAHQRSLATAGPSPIHRYSYAPVSALLG